MCMVAVSIGWWELVEILLCSCLLTGISNNEVIMRLGIRENQNSGPLNLHFHFPWLYYPQLTGLKILLYSKVFWENKRQNVFV